MTRNHAAGVSLNNTVAEVPPSIELAEHIADLVQHRRAQWDDIAALCALADLDHDVLDSVERNGIHAPLAHIHAYAHALGMDTTLRLDVRSVADKSFSSCQACGSHQTFHAQTHLSAIDTCVDAKLALLIEALYDLGIKTSMSCEGGSSDDAHLVFPTLADAQAFFSVVDRGDEGLRLRAGLRSFHSSDLGKQKFKAWEHSIRWHLQPGDVLADAVSWVRFSPAEIKGLTRLMQSPPGPSPWATRSRR
jgi:hypothetical protein